MNIGPTITQTCCTFADLIPVRGASRPVSIVMNVFFNSSIFCASFASTWCSFRSLRNLSMHLGLGLRAVPDLQRSRCSICYGPRAFRGPALLLRFCYKKNKYNYFFYLRMINHVNVIHLFYKQRVTCEKNDVYAFQTWIYCCACISV